MWEAADMVRAPQIGWPTSQAECWAAAIDVNAAACPEADIAGVSPWTLHLLESLYLASNSSAY